MIVGRTNVRPLPESVTIDVMSRPQFSIRALLLTVVAVAVVLALTLHVPTRLAAVTLLVCLLVFSALSLTIIVYRPAYRAFCLGAVVPLASMLVYVGQRLSGLAIMLGEPTRDQDVIFWYDDTIFTTAGVKILGSGLLSSIVLGYLCVVFRWLIEPRSENSP